MQHLCEQWTAWLPDVAKMTGFLIYDKMTNSYMQIDIFFICLFIFLMSIYYICVDFLNKHSIFLFFVFLIEFSGNYLMVRASLG